MRRSQRSRFFSTFKHPSYKRIAKMLRPSEIVPQSDQQPPIHHEYLYHGKRRIRPFQVPKQTIGTKRRDGLGATARDFPGQGGTQSARYLATESHRICPRLGLEAGTALKTRDFPLPAAKLLRVSVGQNPQFFLTRFLPPTYYAA
jgi:hypothetical protein